jgi:hypothetical protein
MEKLRDALDALAERVLPGNIPSVPAIQPAFDTLSAQADRDRLRGALVWCAGDKFHYVPNTASTLGPTSKKLAVSSTGALADAKDLTESQLQALSPEFYTVGAFASADGDVGSGEPALAVQGLPAKLSPIVDPTGLTQGLVTSRGWNASCSGPVHHRHHLLLAAETAMGRQGGGTTTLPHPRRRP